MKNQKICIIGGGLTGLTTALVLKNLNLDIDIFLSEKNTTKKIDERSTAISNSNFVFLKSNIKSLNQNIFWPSKKINLYYEDKNKYSNFLNFEEKNKYLIHIFKNYKYKNNLLKKLNCKNIRIINKEITEINHKSGFVKSNRKKFNYDLVLVCLGAKSNLYNKLIGSRAIKKNYKEMSITGNIKNNFNIKCPAQYFSKEGPIAILPYEKNKTSFVWSVDQDIYFKNKNNLKKLINNKLSAILQSQKKFKIINFQSYPLHLNLQSKYFKNNILVLGEGIHSIHPVAGQGFNLILRDIKKLYELLNYNLKLGLTIKNSLIAKNFFNIRKPENILFGIGIDLTRVFFKYNKQLQPFQNILLRNINKNKIVQKIGKLIADKGLI